MSHAPAICFNLQKRGFIREGYYADLVIAKKSTPHKVTKQNILYSCGWSPLEGNEFNFEITHTIVNGHIAYKNGVINDIKNGKELLFDN